MEIVMIRKRAANVANQGIAPIASILLRPAIKPLLEVDEQSLLGVGISRAVAARNSFFLPDLRSLPCPG
jgi:hypothetical protein